MMFSYYKKQSFFGEANKLVSKGHLVVWWTTHQIAVQEVRGSNPALGSFYFFSFNSNSRILPLRPQYRETHPLSRKRSLDGCTRNLERALVASSQNQQRGSDQDRISTRQIRNKRENSSALLQL